MVLESKASFVCIQETKCLQWKERKLNSIGLGDFIGWVEVPSTGLSGGLISVWDSSVFSITRVSKARNWIWVQGECFASKMAFSCINVYAPVDFHKKSQLWYDLSNILSAVAAIPTMLLRDFNCVLNPRERLNCSYAKVD